MASKAARQITRLLFGGAGPCAPVQQAAHDIEMGRKATPAAQETIAELIDAIAPPPQPVDQVRVLRLVEYTGPRDWVEETVRRAIHGTRQINPQASITGVTIDQFPEILERARQVSATEPKP